MYKTILYSFLFSLIMVVSTRATIFNVAAGTDGITAAVTAAASGDTIQLTTSGGIYVETAIVTNAGKSITFMAAPGLAEKPIWVCSAVSTTGGIIRTYAATRVNGIIFDGTASSTSTTNGIITSGTTAYAINVSDCIFRNFTTAFYGSSSVNTTQVDSVIFNNCIFTKISGQAIITYVNTNAPGSVKNVVVTNSTFYHITGESIYIDASDDVLYTTPEPKVLISHCTFYDSKRVLTHYCDYTVIKDCIFQNPSTRAGQNSYYIYGNNSSITNSLYFNASTSLHTAVSSGLINKDVQFKDTANANFTLVSTSPAINAGSDGTTLGDPRWWHYYSKSTGSLNSVASWGVNSVDGSGPAPSDFTSNGLVFTVRNQSTPTISDAWTVSGAKSKVVVGDGTNATNLVLPFALTCTNLDIQNNATVSLGANSIVNGTCNVLSSGTLNAGTYNFSGTGAVFNLSAGGILKTASADGISASSVSGPVQTTGVRTYSTGAYYVYNGSTAQTTGDGLPATVAGLEINNASGVALSAALTITKSLTLTSGLLLLGSNDINLASDAVVAGNAPSASNMVVASGSGLFKKVLTSAAPHSFTFPVGDNTETVEYSPVSYTLNSGTFTSETVAVKLSNSKHSENTNVSDYLNRYWTLTSDGVTDANYNAVFTYSSSDVTGIESGLSGNLWNGSAWTGLGSVNAAEHTFTAATQSVYGDFTAFGGGAAASGSVNITVIPQGFYNEGGYLNSSDTIEVLLADISSPYAIVDSAYTILDSLTFSATAEFHVAASGTYYLVIKHRNSVETWSASGITFTQGSTVSYDFTSSAGQAYGSNETELSGGKFAIFSGDVNQDGYVDPLDLSLVDGSSFNYESGIALVTDINGDRYVDPLDLSICDQNSYNYIGIKKPSTERILSGREHALTLPGKSILKAKSK